MHPAYDAVVIGGGFFGCMSAVHLRLHYPRVVVMEARDRLLGRASYHNQARVHNGYHYPRSPLTAFRSRFNFPRFVADFEDCIVADFQQYYAVARRFSKISAGRFRQVFDWIGAPIRPAPARIRQMFNPEWIEEVFTVQEYAFDAARLGRRMARALEDAGVAVRLGHEVVRLERLASGSIRLSCDTPRGPEDAVAGMVFNCTYSGLNRVLRSSGLPTIPLKHELTELALIEVPEPLRDLGITVMCGPFFSTMPFPPRRLHTLSHVRYTPHLTWSDAGDTAGDPGEALARTPPRSNYPYMIRDAARFLPVLKESTYVDSLWEVKTVLPASEADDSRPILLRKHSGMPNLHCILGAKIDNIYDALDEVELIARARRAG
jgi:glycine/D-amino acid oxidase-like deaminating enzyme